ncbi:hypothetical protein AUC69_09860 [Methyloceanibacter superfactus]|uniref:Uncharacterized protein n=1 Tax=Methyloceanibacter superfactus TaxID=1774969 RepID=A0A1E3VXE1_9HYPH|nr:hypothetical protein [Methyloceanibacter superfactus]ODR98208.1 hypothetical protein AUC69_09860 [Methyloceanibacter superfactus]
MSDPASVSVRRGSLYLAREVYDRYFPGLDAVVLLRREDDLLILPVRHAASGGYLLKLRNGAGDRVVSAPDFFREQGIGEDMELCLPVTWSPEKAALCAVDIFKLPT